MPWLPIWAFFYFECFLSSNSYSNEECNQIRTKYWLTWISFENCFLYAVIDRILAYLFWFYSKAKYYSKNWIFNRMKFLIQNCWLIAVRIADTTNWYSITFYCKLSCHSVMVQLLALFTFEKSSFIYVYLPMNGWMNIAHSPKTWYSIASNQLNVKPLNYLPKYIHRTNFNPKNKKCLQFCYFGWFPNKCKSHIHSGGWIRMYVYVCACCCVCLNWNPFVKCQQRKFDNKVNYSWIFWH